MIIKSNRLLDDILGGYRDTIGTAFEGYNNHVYRMINFCFALDQISDEEREKIVIAGCFHDIGIWTGGTFDYLPPSIEAANEYLVRGGLETWSDEITLMIGQHHKVRAVPEAQSHLAEIFRKGDLVDFSLGLLSCGVDRNTISTAKRQFPNAGFHKGLARTAGKWLCRHPLNPLPILKW